MSTGPTPAGVQPPRRRRGAGTVRDMVISLAVLGAVLVGFLLVSGLWQNIVIRTGRPAVPAVDVRATASAQASTAPFPLVAPAGLPGGWTGTAAGFQASRGVWHLGLVTPRNGFAGVDETTAPGTGVLDAELPGRTATGTVALASGRWDRYTAARTSGGADRAGLVQRRGTTVVVVSGTADPVELATLAGSLTTVG